MRYDPLIKNNVTVTGNKAASKTLIFAHGFGTDQTAWRLVADAFKDEFRLVLYDNVGAGKALPEAYSPALYTALESYVNDLIDICEALELSDSVIIGHSVSGMISLLASVEAPQHFEKIAVIGASPRYLNDGDYIGGFEQQDLDNIYQTMTTNYYGWISGFAPLAMGNPDRPQLAEEFAQTLSLIRPDIAQAVSKTIFQSDFRHKLGVIQKPVLIIQSDQDIAVPKAVGNYLHRQIRNSKLEEIRAQGHFPHMSAPEEVIQALKRFI